MVHVVVMMMVVMMIMMVMHLMHRGGGRRSRFLRDGIAGEAEREHGGSDKGLDHGKIFLRLREPQRVIAKNTALCLNSI